MLAYDPRVKRKISCRVRGRPPGCATKTSASAASRLLGMLLIALLGAGCGTMKEDAKRIGLENTLNSYRQAIRWGQFQAAAGFVAPGERGDLDSDALANIRVTGYDVVRQGIIGPDDTAVQLVRIDYVLEDRQRLERLLDRQRWRYDAEHEAWWLESGLPTFSASGTAGGR